MVFKLLLSSSFLLLLLLLLLFFSLSSSHNFIYCHFCFLFSSSSSSSSSFSIFFSLFFFFSAFSLLQPPIQSSLFCPFWTSFSGSVQPVSPLRSLSGYSNRYPPVPAPSPLLLHPDAAVLMAVFCLCPTLWPLFAPTAIRLLRLLSDHSGRCLAVLCPARLATPTTVRLF